MNEYALTNEKQSGVQNVRLKILNVISYRYEETNFHVARLCFERLSKDTRKLQELPGPTCKLLFRKNCLNSNLYRNINKKEYYE